MRQKKFALQPLLEQRAHRERVLCGELGQVRRARSDAFERLADVERRHDVASAALGRCAPQGNVIEARAYDAVLRATAALRLRGAIEMRAHDAANELAEAALAIANRERRVLERLRERLEARRAPRRYDD